MGVYGNMTLYFPEQLRTLSYFNMAASVNDGYGSQTEQMPIRGIIQTNESSITDSNGNLATEKHYEVWTRYKLTMGWFIEYQGERFRILSDGDWPKEGGFYIYKIGKLVGNDGNMQAEPAWILIS